MVHTTDEIADLLDVYRVDMPHARHVADLSLTLFDAMSARHALPGRLRPLLESGALLHNVGMTTDPPEHHLVGRDIVLRHPLDDLSHRDQQIIACLVAFHRKKVRPQIEPTFLSLGKKSQQAALQLSAILRVADGLDDSHSQTTSLIGVEDVEGGLLLRLGGPHAADDGVRATEKADLWRRVFGETLSVTAPATEDKPDVADAAEEKGEPLLAPWYAASDVPLADLGRVLLRRHLRRLLSVERAVRADREIEDVHALRVTSRRLRATLRLLAPVAPTARVKPIQKAIRSLADAAGAVRDRDVLLAHLAESRGQLPEELSAGLDDLAAAIGAERARAYARLITMFDSEDHNSFKVAFAELMNSDDGWDAAPRVRDLAGSTIWRQYEALRSHDRGGVPLEGKAMHALRIDAKKLRYVLELFADSFGERAALAVAHLARLQDELGTLNDIEVAQNTLSSANLGEEARAAAAAYLSLRETQRQAAIGVIPARWEKVGSATYRRKLMELIVKL
ncbi:CHAD domain-containing protein [Chloroflexales bacterium ZM16-3]|nr:CHAD domain-containing protein [Chloroflexales bacterium ZM16-3]